MKTNRCSYINRSLPLPVGACGKIAKRLDSVKQSLLLESSRSLNPEPRLLRLAVNEAEALAWQTAYPHLLFPVLAEEKAANARQWSARQRVVKLESPIMAFAA